MTPEQQKLVATVKELFEATYEGMSDIERQGADFAVAAIEQACERKGRKEGCHHCRFFSVSARSPNEPAFWCSQWQDVVPEPNRAKGCDKFYFDEIPF